MSDRVRVQLAHPLTERDLEYLGLPEGDGYLPGAWIVVRADHAPALVASGYLAVDSDNKRAVAKALHPSPKYAKTPFGLAPEDGDQDAQSQEKSDDGPDAPHAMPSATSGQTPAVGAAKGPQRSSVTKAAADAARG
jgi:hypothetical protein